MVGFFIALISGALMSVQGVFNTKVTEASSMWAANAFVQFTAFLVCIVVRGQDVISGCACRGAEIFPAGRGNRGIYHADRH